MTFHGTRPSVDRQFRALSQCPPRICSVWINIEDAILTSAWKIIRATGIASGADVGAALVRFPEILLNAARLYRPSILADYLYALAGHYSNFYQNVPFLKEAEGIRESRVRLCAAVACVLRQGLELLGIEAPERI